MGTFYDLYDFHGLGRVSLQHPIGIFHDFHDFKERYPSTRWDFHVRSGCSTAGELLVNYLCATVATLAKVLSELGSRRAGTECIGT